MARYDIPSAEFDVAGARIGIVAARFNDDVVFRLLEAALDTLDRHGLDRERIPVARVPGAFELPLAARWLAIRYGSLTDTGGLCRPRERRRIVQEATAPGDEHIGEGGVATAHPPITAASAGRGRDGASPAARGGRGAAVLDAEHAGGDDMAARERRGTTLPDDEQAGEHGWPRERPRNSRNATIAGNVAADAIIALGAVIRGDTPHFDYVCAEAARGILAVSLELDVPVVFGVLTCDDHAQALVRAGGERVIETIYDPFYGTVERHTEPGPNKGREAALAALEMVSLRRRLGA